MTLLYKRIATPAPLLRKRASIVLSPTGDKSSSTEPRFQARKWSASILPKMERPPLFALFEKAPHPTLSVGRLISNGSNANVYQATLTTADAQTYPCAVKPTPSESEVHFYNDAYPKLTPDEKKFFIEAVVQTITEPKIGLNAPTQVLIMSLAVPLKQLANGLSENLCFYTDISENPGSVDADSTLSQTYSGFISEILEYHHVFGQDEDYRFFAQVSLALVVDDILRMAMSLKGQGSFWHDLKLDNILWAPTNRAVGADQDQRVVYGSSSDGIHVGTAMFSSPQQLEADQKLDDSAVLWMIGHAAMSLALNGRELLNLLHPGERMVSLYQYINAVKTAPKDDSHDNLFYPLGDANLQRFLSLVFAQISDKGGIQHGQTTLSLFTLFQSFIYHPSKMYNQPPEHPTFTNIEGIERPFPCSLEEAKRELEHVLAHMQDKFDRKYPDGIDLIIPTEEDGDDGEAIHIKTARDCIAYMLNCA